MPKRNHEDASLIAEVALPAAAANVNTGSIDLGAAPRETTLESVEIGVELDDLPAAFAAAATLTFTLQDSADGSSFTAIPELATVVFTGTGAAIANLRKRAKLPVTVRQYLRANIALSSGGGAITAYKGRIKIKA